jgi:hypothetical protein
VECFHNVFCIIVLPTQFALVRRIACPADSLVVKNFRNFLIDTEKRNEYNDNRTCNDCFCRNGKMLTQITRYVAMTAIFLHSLLCGNMVCCATLCAANDVAASVSHDFSLPSCPCHSEKQDAPLESEQVGCDNSKHVCDYPYHFCQCLQSVTPNNGSALRILLSQSIHPLPDVFLSTTVVFPTTAINPGTPETVGDWSAHGVRLHLLLEHFLM